VIRTSMTSERPSSEADKIRIRLAANDPTLTSVELAKKTSSENEGSSSSSSSSDATTNTILIISNQDELHLATQALCGNTFVERLGVGGGVTVTDELLQKALPTLTQLRHLKLQRAGLSVAMAKTLVNSSSTTSDWMQQLLTLNLSDNVNLGPRGCRQLAEGLRRTTHLLELNLSNVRMGHYGSQALAESNTVSSASPSSSSLPRTLQRLNLSHNGIGPDGLWKLAESALPSLSALQHLDLSYNNILDDGCLEIAKLLVHRTTTKAAHRPSLVTLRLAGNGIGDTGVAGLAKALGEHTTRPSSSNGDTAAAAAAAAAAASILLLEELDLHDNRITDVGATALAEEALSCRKLQEEAEEAENESTDEDDEEDEESDASAILDAEPVGERHQWKILNLSKNQIGNAGCSALAVALSSAASIVVVHSLDLSHNSIGDEGAGAFVELIDDMVGLVDLNLSGNPELTEARTRILDMLLKHRRHGDATTTTDHSERSEHTHTSAASAHTVQQQQQQQQFSEHSMVSMDNRHYNQQQEKNRIEKEQAIEEGRKKLLQCLATTSGGKGSSNITEIPQVYASHLTENFSAERIIQYGAFGPLYTATVHPAADDSETESSGSIMYVRHLKLGAPGAMAVARDAILQEVIQLGASAHENLWLPVAYTTNFCFVYRNNTPHPHTSLADVLRDEKQRRQLTWKARVHCLRAVAQALAFLHSHDAGHKSTFHGDVCSQNIFLVPQGNDEHQEDYSECSFQLADGGLSRLLATDRARFTSGDVVFGSRGYRCPRYERGSCPYDSASDMFSFGIVVAEITTGRLQGSKQEQPAKTNASSSSTPTSSSLLAWDAYYELSGIITRQPTIPVDLKAGPVPKNLIEIVAKILLSCVTPLVERRPTSMTVANILSQISFV